MSVPGEGGTGAGDGSVPALLTISQLAAYVGVTVRAVRHYHQRGLLPEPERDASGYRRYGTRAVLDLIRIKVLSGAGVPLGRVDELLAADPDELAASVARIDADLVEQMEELRRRREHLAALVGGDRLFVPSRSPSTSTSCAGPGSARRRSAPSGTAGS